MSSGRTSRESVVLWVGLLMLIVIAAAIALFVLRLAR